MFKMKSQASKLVNSSALRIIGFFAVAIISLMMTPFVIHSLGDKMYGLWVFLGTFLGYYGLMDFGISSAIQRYYSKALVIEDYDEANIIINTSLIIFTCIGFMVLIVSFGIAVIVPMIMNNLDEKKLFEIVIIIMGINFALGFPLRVFSGILCVHLRHDINSGLEITKLIIRTFFVIIYLSNGHGIIALAIITLLSDVIFYMIKYLFCRYKYKFIVISMKYFDKKRILTLFEYSLYTFIIQISDQLRFNIDNLVIASCIGLNSVTMFSVAASLVRYFMNFIVSAVGITLPIFSKYDALGDLDSIRDKYLFVTKICSYLSLLVGSYLVIFGKQFIDKWMGINYIQSYYIMLILLVPFIFDLMQTTCSSLLCGMSKHKYYAYSNTLEGVANLILSLILVKHIGLYGVALGTAIPMLISKIIVQPIYTCRIIKISCFEYYLKFMAPILCLSSFVIVIFCAVFKNIIVPNYFNIASLIAVETGIFIITIWMFGLNKKEKTILKGGFFAG